MSELSSQPSNKKSLTFSIIAGLAAVIAVLSGLMVENPGMIPVSDTLRALVVLGSTAVVGSFICHAIWPRMLPIFPIMLYGLFQLRSLDAMLPQIKFSSFIAFSLTTTFITILYFTLRRTTILAGTQLICFVAIAAALSTAAPSAMRKVTSTASLTLSSGTLINEEFARNTVPASPLSQAEKENLPDIIYVIPDRYPNSETLRTKFGYDNSQFYQKLRGRGFVLTENAQANYGRSFVSLASMLNSGYLDKMTELYGAASTDRLPIFKLIENNIVQKRLRQIGYRFIQYGNWWAPSQKNINADENFMGFLPTAPLHARLPRIEQILFQKSMLSKVTDKLIPSSKSYECERIKNQLTQLRSVGNKSKPVFLFFHAIIPHPPIQTDANGNCLKLPLIFYNTSWEKYKDAFLQYLKYFNQQILEVIDEQNSRRKNNGRNLIFVIQSDEGPYPKAKHLTLKPAIAKAKRLSLTPPPPYNYFAAPPDELRMRFGIINAMLGPADTNANLQTPINNWRIIFNKVLGTNLKKLPHRSFVFQDENNFLDFREITDILSSPKR